VNQVGGNINHVGVGVSNEFILIPGRTSRQGCGFSEGKFSDNYEEETNLLQVAPEDMERLELSDGDRVRVTSATGNIEVGVIAAKGDELPPGVLFIAYGDMSSRLMGGDTHGTGIPTSKGLDVVLEKIGA
jgi:formylmethanofuran dehydrogenase subunit D